MRRIAFWFLLLSGLSAASQRVCETPDCLLVSSARPTKTVSLFLYVPPTTETFTLAIFDQDDETPVQRPSEFLLFAPDGRPAFRLDRPKKKAWSEYPIRVKGRWGIWRLTVKGPIPAGKGTAYNYFLVRTLGEVDLYFRPVPAVMARGLRLSEPRFGGSATHRFTLQVPAISYIRFHFLRPLDERVVQVRLSPPKGILFEKRWGGLSRGTLEVLEVKGKNLRGLWELRVEDVKGIYALGIEQELRLFCTEEPLMPIPQRVEVTTFVPGSGEFVPARLEITAPQTATEPYVTFTDERGFGHLFLLPGIIYRIVASRGFEFEPQEVFVTAGMKAFSVLIRRRLKRRPGWFCGDNHTHTVYSDGTDTPAQMVEAARGDGLDWITLTDHGFGPFVRHVQKAHEEGRAFSRPGVFVVIPGEEFTTPRYHLNIIGGVISESPLAPMHRVINAVLQEDNPDRPMTVKLNHPYWKGAPKAAEVVLKLKRLPLIELWNSKEPETTRLWWKLLCQGIKVFAETSSDMHDRKGARLGYRRRTYVYLGDKPLTAANIIKALREGKSFLSRGALLYLTVNGVLPGGRVLSSGGVTVKVEMESAFPVDRIEVIHDGRIIHTFCLNGKHSFEGKVRLPLKRGWVLVQAMPQDHPVPLALTNPVFIEMRESRGGES